jgi:hypothetical protein
MLDDVKSRVNNFGISATTEKKRAPVLVGIVLLMFASFFLMLFTGYEINIAEKNYTITVKKIEASNQDRNKILFLENLKKTKNLSSFDFGEPKTHKKATFLILQISRF